MKLKDSLVSALQFYKARETELAWIDALLDMSKSKTDTGSTDEGKKGKTSRLLLQGV